MERLVLVISIVFSLISSMVFANSALPYPTKMQREQIAIQLINSIEQLDAVTIKLRNETRTIHWHAFKSRIEKSFTEARDWSELSLAIRKAHYGILNRHSYILPGTGIPKVSNTVKKWPKLSIGYTWPDISFYSTANLKEIKSINGLAITQIFNDFFELYCNDVHQSGCLKLFSSYLNTGFWFLGGEKNLTITYQDNSSKVIDETNTTSHLNTLNKKCAKAYPTLGLSLVYNGKQSCLFETDSTYILKISEFGNWGSNYNDIYCVNPSQLGMCADINHIKTITNNDTKNLIIDLQNNLGGNENTPWIAALTQGGFKDNLIQYKKLEVLKNAKIRANAFYFNDRAEAWYQNVIRNNTAEGEFFPSRGDFCRGSPLCQPDWISSAKYPIKYKQLKVVVNSQCISSCDDFVWRIKQYAGAKTYGQLPATDGTYARLDGYIFINESGKVINIITGEGSDEEKPTGRILLSYRLPISKTVNHDGISLEGNTDVLDHPLPITQFNFASLDESNIRHILNL